MTPEVITSKDRMSSATMIEGAEKSFAKEYLTVNNDMDSLTHYSIYFVSDKEDID